MFRSFLWYRWTPMTMKRMMTTPMSWQRADAWQSGERLTTRNHVRDPSSPYFYAISHRELIVRCGYKQLQRTIHPHARHQPIPTMTILTLMVVHGQSLSKKRLAVSKIYSHH
jgi:hypothetical protein